MIGTTQEITRKIKIAHEKRLQLARSTQKIKTEMARNVLEDLVRAAYPDLAGQCLCARCLGEIMRRGAGRAKC